MKYKSIYLVSLILSVILLPGCGGGGGGGGDDGPTGTTYTGSTAQATVDSSNAKQLTTGAASGTQQAVASDAISGVAMRPQPNPTSKLEELAPRIAQWIHQLQGANAARTVDLTDEICDAGGSAVAETNDAETQGSITFSSCAMSDMEGGTVVLNGSLTFTANTGADTLSMVFRVTVTYIGENQSINMSLACSNISSASPSCSLTADFTGIDGRIYRIEDLSVNGSESSGFYVSMRLYDPDYGWVDVTTSQALTYVCASGVPGSGMISVTGVGGTFATASFDSCSAFTVTVEGVGTIYNW